MQAFRHFRSVFDVVGANHIAKPWLALVGEVRAWVARREQVQLNGAFFAGGEWKQPPPTSATIRTRCLTQDNRDPSMWAVRYEHADTEVRARTWTTDVTITAVGTRAWRMAIEQRHHLPNDYVGPEPALPLPASPDLVLTLTRSPNWTCHVADQRLTAWPVVMEPRDVRDFARLLADPLRRVLIVFLGIDRQTHELGLSGMALARAIAGTGIVYLCEGPKCQEELSRVMPRWLRTDDRSVRIYAPGVDVANEWTTPRHRVYRPKEIVELGSAEVIAQIARALTRRDGWPGLHAPVLSIDDVDARMRTQRLVELRQMRKAS